VNWHLTGGAAQQAFGQALSSYVAPPLVIYLHGDLGVGKTTLVRGLLRGLGHQGRVVSPTYTLVESYRPTSFALHHLDLYRLGDPHELEYLGLDDLCDGASVLLIEWPEKGQGILPPADVHILISHAGDSRELVISAEGQVGLAIAGQLREAQLVSEKSL
jgi:tRNA threonylcarbamoyladenosine biosynthesis protein TsaE